MAKRKQETTEQLLHRFAAEYNAHLDNLADTPLDERVPSTEKLDPDTASVLIAVLAQAGVDVMEPDEGGGITWEDCALPEVQDNDHVVRAVNAMWERVQGEQPARVYVASTLVNGLPKVVAHAHTPYLLQTVVRDAYTTDPLGGPDWHGTEADYSARDAYLEAWQSAFKTACALAGINSEPIAVTVQGHTFYVQAFAPEMY